MEKNKEKKAESLKEIEILEKEFHKTVYGKFMMVATILFIVLLAIGLGIAVFEAIVNFRNLDMNTYQPIIDLGDFCRYCGGNGIFYAMILYISVLPILMKDKKETSEKNSKKSKSKIWTVLSVLFSIVIIGYALKFIYGIVPIVGRIMAI